MADNEVGVQEDGCKGVRNLDKDLCVMYPALSSHMKVLLLIERAVAHWKHTP